MKNLNVDLDLTYEAPVAGDDVASEVSIQVEGELTRVEQFEIEAKKALEQLAYEHGVTVEKIYVG